MQRDYNKKIYSDLFEATASGSALKGETPLEAAKRELREETFSSIKVKYSREGYMNYISISDENRAMVNEFIIKHWYSTKIIARGKEYDLSTANGIMAFENNQIKGLVTYIFYDDICEIMSLDSLEPSKGIGTSLINKVIAVSKLAACKKIILITTNDNINAIGFYQRRGFDMVKLYHNALDLSRALKPEIPLIGDNNIPLKHEIEFEMDL